MMTRSLFIFLIFLCASCDSSAQSYVFYLHGKIVEDQGAKAVDNINGFGAYQYNDIVSAFRKEGFTVISEVRKKDTDPKTYSLKVVKQIDSLIKRGVKAESITIVGASKGAIISMLISSNLKNKNVNFVFMAGCFNDISESNPDINFYGNILSIHEKSDVIGKSCLPVKNKSTGITHYKEIEINTGLRHGFLYQPFIVLMNPTIQWASGKYN